MKTVIPKIILYSTSLFWNKRLENNRIIWK